MMSDLVVIHSQPEFSAIHAMLLDGLRKQTEE